MSILSTFKDKHVQFEVGRWSRKDKIVSTYSLNGLLMHFAPGCRGLSRLFFCNEGQPAAAPCPGKTKQLRELATHSDLLSVNDSDVDGRAYL